LAGERSSVALSIAVMCCDVYVLCTGISLLVRKFDFCGFYVKVSGEFISKLVYCTINDKDLENS